MSLKPERKIHSCAIHRGDFVCFCKFLTGEWIADLENGEIYSTISKRILKFSKKNNGYLNIMTSHMGRKYNILKHRAIYIAGMGLFNLPENFYMEVDHINGDKTDCRLKNLRLLTKVENSTYGTGVFTYEQAEEIRAEYAKGDVSKTALAEKYKCDRKTIYRLLRNETYVRERQ